MKEKQLTMLKLWHAVQGLFIQAYFKGLFTCRNLVCVVPKQRMIEKELKMMEYKNKHAICALLLTGLNNQQSYHNHRLVVTPNEMVSLYCHDQPLFVPGGTRIFQAKAVYMQVRHSSTSPVSTVLRKLVTFFIINILSITKTLSKLKSGQYSV